MSVELITGKASTDHVTSNHARLLNAGILGSDHYLLKELSWDTPPSMQDANTVIIPPRVLMMNGAQVVIDQPETVNIQSGSQGQRRSDLVVCRYSLDTGTGYETASLMAIKGEPVSGSTPSDPQIESESILGGAIVHDMPICRVNLDGITVTGVDDLEQVLTPVQDSLTQMREYGFTTCSAGIATKAIPANGTHAFNSTWMRAFASTPQVVGWYANDNIWSVTVTNVTKTGARIIVRNVSSSINGVESRVYVTAYGQLA